MKNTSVLKEHLEKLASFVDVSDAGSIRKAAEYKRISQPALTRQIQNLEEALSVKLFIRSNKGIVLSAAGSTLLAFSRRLLSDTLEFEKGLMNREISIEGDVSVGTFETLSIRVWPKIIVECSDRYPKLKINVQSASTDELYRGILDRRLDLAMTLLRGSNKTIKAIPLFTDSYGFFARQKIEKPEMSPLALVGDADLDQKFTLQEFLRSKNLQFDPVYQVGTFEAAKNYALVGAAMAILPFSLALPLVKKGKLHAISIPGISGKGFGSHAIGLLVQNDRLAQPAMSALVEQIRRKFK